MSLIVQSESNYILYFEPDHQLSVVLAGRITTSTTEPSLYACTVGYLRGM